MTMILKQSNTRREEFVETGLTILRGMIPPALLTELRTETDKAREIARQQHGGQTQRLQPVFAYEALNPHPFRDFLNLLALHEAREQILGSEYEVSNNMGVFFEPADQAWCTNWHRDWAHHVPHPDMELFFKTARTLGGFNQFNAALHDDASLWVVPGSHERKDTPEEVAAMGTIPASPPAFSPEMCSDEREAVCLAYARSMPRAKQVILEAGDVAFYCAAAWHIGCYTPTVPRATLHDNFPVPADYVWREAVHRMRATQEDKK